jgi:hypothetical protein
VGLTDRPCQRVGRDTFADWGLLKLPVTAGGPRSPHRLRSEKSRGHIEGRGFDSRHLHCLFCFKCAAQSPSSEGLSSRQDTSRTQQDTEPADRGGEFRSDLVTLGGQLVG